MKTATQQPNPVPLPQAPEQQPPPTVEQVQEQSKIIFASLERQRNQALTQQVNMEVEMHLMAKRIEELEGLVKELGGEVPDPNAPPQAPLKEEPKTNGTLS